MRPIARIAPMHPTRAPLDAAARGASLRARRAGESYAAVARGAWPAADTDRAGLDRLAALARAVPGSDVEVAVRVYADGRSVSVARRVLDGRTVGIEATIR